MREYEYFTWEINLSYEIGPIYDRGETLRRTGGKKPPENESRKQEKRIVGCIESHELGKNNKHDNHEKEGIEEGPYESENRIFISNFEI
jgi:hypothetical protein